MNKLEPAWCNITVFKIKAAVPIAIEGSLATLGEDSGAQETTEGEHRDVSPSPMH